MTSSPIKVVFLVADYGQDPTETAVPYQTFKKAGFEVTFITENGKTPACDSRMMSGVTGKLLGAAQPAIDAYNEMSKTPEWQNPLAWSDPSTTLEPFDLLFLPGGHDSHVRQLLDSTRAQQLIADFWPAIRAPGGRKVCGAVCHGVQLLAHARFPATHGDAAHAGKSVLHDVRTTALTGTLENAAYWSTRLFLGDYYKTYGAGTSNVEDVVRAALDDPAKQWQGPANPSAPFVLRDPNYNYLSARWPGDVQLLADQTVEAVKQLKGEK